MPHIVVLYTANLDEPSDDVGLRMDQLCRQLADTLLAVRDEADEPVFPIGGVRVFAYPAPYFAVADGSTLGRETDGFVYVNLRMGRGRSEGVKRRTGDALAVAAQTHIAQLLERRGVGLTIQIDEGPEVYDAKVGNLHARYKKG